MNDGCYITVVLQISGNDTGVVHRNAYNAFPTTVRKRADRVVGPYGRTHQCVPYNRADRVVYPKSIIPVDPYAAGACGSKGGKGIIGIVI
jgi:hypothetical protein